VAAVFGSLVLGEKTKEEGGQRLRLREMKIAIAFLYPHLFLHLCLPQIFLRPLASKFSSLDKNIYFLNAW
jgi:hypothetical protein